VPAAQGAAVVVVAGQDVQWRAKWREELAHLLVLRIGCVVGEVAGHEHRIRRLPDRADAVDRRREPRHRITVIVGPVGSDVRIAEVREQKRGAHDDIIAVAA
jgi:uncharacterized membrane protein YqgA involved in biofilm formation